MARGQRRVLLALVMFCLFSLLYVGSYMILRYNHYFVRSASVEFGFGMYVVVDEMIVGSYDPDEVAPIDDPPSAMHQGILDCYVPMIHAEAWTQWLWYKVRHNF